MKEPLTEPAQVCARPEPREASAWFVAFGISLILLTGFSACSARAAAGAVYPAGIVMLPGALAAVGLTPQIRSWGASGAWLFSALLYAAAALLAFTDPTFASAPTLPLALMLMAAGLMRMWWSMALPAPRGLGWMTASGAVTLLAGLIFVGWPDAPWLAGIVCALDAGVQGGAAIAFGWALTRS